METDLVYTNISQCTQCDNSKVNLECLLVVSIFEVLETLLLILTHGFLFINLIVLFKIYSHIIYFKKTHLNEVISISH